MWLSIDNHALTLEIKCLKWYVHIEFKVKMPTCKWCVYVRKCIVLFLCYVVIAVLLKMP